MHSQSYVYKNEDGASWDEVISAYLMSLLSKCRTTLPVWLITLCMPLNSYDGPLTFEILPAAAAHGLQCPGCDWVCGHLPL